MHSDENQICLFSSWLAGCTRIKLDLFRESLSECFANRLCNIASWSCSSRNATYQMAFQHMHGRRHTKSLYVFTVMTPWDTVVTQHLILHLIVDHLTCYSVKHMPSSLCETNEPPKRPNKQENAAKAKLCCLSDSSPTSVHIHLRDGALLQDSSCGHG